MVRLIKINEKDNVAVVASEEGFEVGKTYEPLNITAYEFIPFGQKITLKDLKKDEDVIRYGEIIGYLNDEKKAGSLIDEHSVYIKDVDSMYDEEHVKYNPNPRSLKYQDERYFMGYLNKDGTAGTRNLLAINTTVQCSEGFVNVLVEKIKKELLPLYKNVDGVVALNHLYGCGVAINGDGAEIPKRTIKNLKDNPNFGGVGLAICLGCEKFTKEMAFPEFERENVLTMQDFGSFDSLMNSAMKRAESLLKYLNQRKRQALPLSYLRVGAQCGGSDAFSGMTSNSAIGYAFDRLVSHGASVIFSEVTEVRDGVHLLFKRIKDEELREKMMQEMRWYDKYLLNAHVDRAANPTPGNKKGGLTTIIDKALGSIQKSGTTDIVDVLSIGEKIKKPGLSFAATPASDFYCGTEQLASGINLMLFSTGRGTTYNLEAVPVIKIASNTKLYNFWHDFMDINAGTIATCDETVEEVGEKLVDLIIDVASGRTITKADFYKMYNQLAVFNPAPIT